MKLNISGSYQVLASNELMQTAFKYIISTNALLRFYRILVHKLK